MNDFKRIKIRSKEQFVSTVSRHYNYYKSLDVFTFSPEAMYAQVAQMFVKFQELSNTARPLNVYLVVGRLNSAGTVSDNGILIGAEQFAKEMPIELVRMGYKFNPLDSLLSTIAHEHSLQNQAGPATLIRAVIFEGGADFLSELTTGVSSAAQEHYRYGLSHEKQVWKAFAADMYSTDVSNWIANKKREDWPADMGYYIGFQIAKNFYHNMDDKREAFRHLTNVSDPEFILKVSQYGGHFK